MFATISSASASAPPAAYGFCQRLEVLERVGAEHLSEQSEHDGADDDPDDRHPAPRQQSTLGEEEEEQRRGEEQRWQKEPRPQPGHRLAGRKGAGLGQQRVEGVLVGESGEREQASQADEDPADRVLGAARGDEGADGRKARTTIPNRASPSVTIRSCSTPGVERLRIRNASAANVSAMAIAQTAQARRVVPLPAHRCTFGPRSQSDT